jgi:hypothetical protein
MLPGPINEDYLVHGYGKSDDGRTGWKNRSVFAPPEMKMFDFCIRQRSDRFGAIFSRVWLKDASTRPETGLWWCRAEKPWGTLSDWDQPIQISDGSGLRLAFWALEAFDCER